MTMTAKDVLAIAEQGEWRTVYFTTTLTLPISDGKGRYKNEADKISGVFIGISGNPGMILMECMGRQLYVPLLYVLDVV